MRYITEVGGRSYIIEINREGEVVQDNVAHQLDVRAIDSEGLYSLLVDNESYEALIEESEGEYRVIIDGAMYPVRVVDERAKRLADAAAVSAPSSGEVAIKSPMPGLIVSLPVSEGDAVKKGQVVVVLESMKMENELKAPRNGTVKSVKVITRQTVDQNQVLLVLS